MKVIVCGVRFGQFYIEAIRRCKGFRSAGPLFLTNYMYYPYQTAKDGKA